jgi:DNA invertase Pin-like site-specific DNA recombinase
MEGVSKPPKVALYARVSTDDQCVGLQVDELQAEAARRGWNVAGTYIDEGVSGSRERRPALDRLLGDVRAGKVGLVAVWKLDRLGRSMQHLITLLDTLKRHEVDFVSLKDSGIDTTTATGTLMLQILAAADRNDEQHSRSSRPSPGRLGRSEKIHYVNSWGSWSPSLFHIGA